MAAVAATDTDFVLIASKIIFIKYFLIKNLRMKKFENVAESGLVFTGAVVEDFGA